MDLLNMNDYAVHPKLIGPDGKPDSIHLMGKRRVTLPDGYKVDQNWLALASKITVFESRTSRTPLKLQPAVAVPLVSVPVTVTPTDVQKAQSEAIRQAQAERRAAQAADVANASVEVAEKPATN